MNEEQAKQIIRETFEQPFDKSRFVSFSKNLLNQIESSTFSYHGSYIPDAYRPYISVFERVGKFNDGENRIDVLIVKLAKDISFERARTRQRNFIAGYLQGKYGSSNKKDAALVAFISQNDADWRFSLVRMDYRFEETATGKTKIEEEFTPARRWSFLVGVNEKSHTAQSQLVDMLADDEKSPNLSELEKAFNIETVTKEFFLQYRDLFIRTKEALDKTLNSSPKIQDDFKNKHVNTVDFAKKLLGQIVFLYFLQKKGWFGVERDADWGTGSKQFLRELFEKKHGDYANFFNEILEPLFYQALRVGEERKQDDYYYSRFNCKIPFLNGGLFDPIGNYDWVHTDILLPDSLFSNHNKNREGDIGNGILDILDRYNFTVKEDEPMEKEVAIDPELLGKAYEKFNAIRPDNFNEYRKALKSGKKGDESKFNKQYGVYYTPREIVHYMCQQSLINYLATETEGKISKDDIEILIHFGEQVTENEERVLKTGKETATYSYKLPENIRNNAAIIDRKLEDINICDPAVGSGAFPVGMMGEIVKARNILTPFVKRNKRTPYEFKRRCIEHSIYGVDIDPGAVEIAKLRLWLSLIVDEDDIKNIQPLPNLDYKIVCGNSLLGVEKDVFNSTLFQELERLKPLYFDETNPTRKQGLKKEIDGLISQITNGHKEFDFEVYFSEVFHRKNGFDVVIANPPYVRADNPDFKNQREAIMNSGQYKTLYERWDLFVPFIERGLNLLGKYGFLCYITSNALLTSKFAFRILEYIQTYYSVQFIDYFDDAWVFEAGVVPVVFGIAREAVLPVVRKQVHYGSFTNISNKEDVPLFKFKKLSKNAFRFGGRSFNIGVSVIQLGNICYLSYGLRPNSDERYWRGEFTRDDLVSDIPDSKHPKLYLEGKNLSRYRIDKILYLEWGTERVPKKLVRPTFPQLYDRPKLVCGTMTGGTYDETGIICNHSIVVFIRFSDLRGLENKSITMSIKKFNSLPRMKLEKISNRFKLKYILA